MGTVNDQIVQLLSTYAVQVLDRKHTVDTVQLTSDDRGEYVGHDLAHEDLLQVARASSLVHLG